jgi:hypothetical protein
VSVPVTTRIGTFRVCTCAFNSRYNVEPIQLRQHQIEHHDVRYETRVDALQRINAIGDSCHKEAGRDELLSIELP